MRILKNKHTIFTAGLVLFCLVNSFGQDHGNTITQDPKFEQLLAEKRKINSSITVNDRYKIQIFYGENDKARKTLTEFKRDFKNMDGTMIFASPTYKVWIGNFKSRIEAERNLAEVKKKYPYALLIKPNK
jgi:uncharacterized protein YxjI